MPRRFKVTVVASLIPMDQDADQIAEDAADWLRNKRRSHHLLMVYQNDDRGITFVFNNPNTAMLFKLPHQ